VLASMAKYTLAGVAFKSKDAIRKHYQAVRDSHGLYDEIRDPVVLELYKWHPDWEKKTEESSTLWIDWHRHLDFAPTKQIMIKRPGKESLDISYKVALDTFSNSKARLPEKVWLNEFRRAARCEIEDQINEVGRWGMVVDHVKPKTFEVLLRDWIIDNQLKVSDVPIASLDGPVSRWEFASKDHSASWRAFHKENAKLEAITKEEHNTRGHIKVSWDGLV
jgi:hypothetical protein